MKTIAQLFAIIFACHTVASENVLREIQSGGLRIQYVTEPVNNTLTWKLCIKDGAILWQRSFKPTNPLETHTLKNSQLIAIHVEKSELSALISQEIGHLWVICNKNTEGIWVKSSETLLYGISSYKLRTKSIELPGVGVVRVVSEGGGITSFTRTEGGEILCNGQPYANKPEGSIIISKP